MTVDNWNEEEKRKVMTEMRGWAAGNATRGDAHKHVSLSYPIYLLWDVTRASIRE